MPLLLGAEKAINKIQYSLMIKTSGKLRIGGNFHNLIWERYEQPIDKIIINSERLASFAL